MKPEHRTSIIPITEKYLQGELPMLEQDRFVSGGEYGGSEAESGGLSGIPEIPCLIFVIKM